MLFLLPRAEGVFLSARNRVRGGVTLAAQRTLKLANVMNLSTMKSRRLHPNSNTTNEYSYRLAAEQADGRQV